MNERIQELQAEQSYDKAHGISSYHLQEAEQIPVAWVKFQNGEITHAELSDGSGADMDLSDWTPLYAAPVRTKDLTDALKHYADTYCEGWCKETGGTFEDCGGCKARAAIAAYKEKNSA